MIGIKKKTGKKVKDGTIYLGPSPDTNEILYAMPEDMPGTLIWDEAMKYASDYDNKGHDDWRLPTEGELNLLFEHRNTGFLKGTFNVSGSTEYDTKHARWYWSSSKRKLFDVHAYQKDFGIGRDGYYEFSDNASVRLVRGESAEQPQNISDPMSEMEKLSNALLNPPSVSDIPPPPSHK